MKTSLRNTKSFRSGLIAVFSILLFSGLLLSSNKASAQSLGGKKWQLQNPDISYHSEILDLGSDNSLSYMVLDLNSGRKSCINGIYKVADSKLTLNFGDTIIIKFLMVWINADKVALYGKNGSILYYAKMGSAEDIFFRDFLISKSNGGNSYNPGNNNAPASKPQACYTCFGSGQCKVCNGSGRTPGMYGQPSSTCSACGGSGKCWHCNGSGKQ